MSGAGDKYPRVKLGGFDTIRATLGELSAIMVEDCKGRSPDSVPQLVFSSNGQGVSLAGTRPDFGRIMQSADIVHADGMSVVLASRLFTKTPLPERCATTDFFHYAAQDAIKHDLSFYILGATETQNLKVVEAMQALYPGLRIAGRRNGYFKPEDEAQICADIRASGADVVWVALGKPLQEYWCVRNRENLRGVGWVKTCGGLYGYMVGDEKRAPSWVQKSGLEWLYRTLQSPRRLGWRYLITNPHSLYRLARFSG